MDITSHVAIGQVDLVVDSMTYPSDIFFLFFAVFLGNQYPYLYTLTVQLTIQYIFQEKFCATFASVSRASDSGCTILKLNISRALPGATKKMAIFTLVPFDFSDFESPRDHNTAQ